MNTVIIKRHGSIPRMGCYGTLATNGFHCRTGEREDLGNEPTISCIPLGHYNCKWRDITGSILAKHTGYDHLYEIIDVPGRIGIFLHNANYPSQVEGCIFLGDGWGCFGSEWGVTNSRKTLEAFHAIMQGRDFMLSIERNYI
jgi:Family of unknown function (DUF5675)